MLRASERLELAEDEFATAGATLADVTVDPVAGLVTTHSVAGTQVTPSVVSAENPVQNAEDPNLEAGGRIVVRVSDLDRRVIRKDLRTRDPMRHERREGGGVDRMSLHGPVEELDDMTDQDVERHITKGGL